MTWINKIAFNRGIRNESPNKELAKELGDTENSEGIHEISKYLYDKNKSISSDCLAVLYTIGYTKPELIQDYVDDFLKLLESKINRMVWGSMIALSTIAKLKSDYLYKKIDLILKTMSEGTLITEVWGIQTLVNLSIDNVKHKNKLLPILFDYLEKCRPIDFPKRVETILPVIERIKEIEMLDRIIEIKSADLTDSQAKKLKTALKKSKR